VKTTLRSALQAAEQRRREVVMEVPPGSRSRPRTRLCISVTPLPTIRSISGALLVIFEERPSMGRHGVGVKRLLVSW